MSKFGWDLPPGAANDPNAPWNQDDAHDSRCPWNEDWQCDECAKAKANGCLHAEGLDCICADLEADAKADAAQAKLDAWKERGL